MRAYFRSLWNHICRGLAAFFAGMTSDTTESESTAPAPRPQEPDEEAALLPSLPSFEHLRVEFDPAGESIQWETAITLGEFSLLAYTEPHNRILVTRLIGCDDTAILDEESMSGFMTLQGDVAVIAFRGTDMYSPRDWLKNIDFHDRTAFDRDREVHRGFYNAYALFAEQIKTLIAEHKPKYVWITGHSLGGAMATCCAYDLSVHDIPFTGLVTFGQPRIGNQAMAQYLQDNVGPRHLRFVNESDFLPLVPPGIGLILPDYWHCGFRIRFNAGNLDRRDGLQLFSATGPVETSTALESTSDLGQDGEETLTEEETKELQEYLQAAPPDAGADLPAGLAGNAPPFDSAEATPGTAAVTAMPAIPGWAEELLQLIIQGIRDHSMDEYVNKLNEYRNHHQNG